MPRSPSGSWITSRGVWVASLGEPYVDARGRRKRRQVPLTYPDGTPVRRYDDAGRLEAIARLIRHNAAAEREAGMRKADPTLEELFGMFVDWHRIRDSSDKTIDQYRRIARRIVEARLRGVPLGEARVSTIGDDHLMALRAHMRSKGASPAYLKSAESAFLACMRWAFKAVESRDPVRILPRDPFPLRSVERVTAPPSDRASPGWDEMLAIFDAVDAFVEGRSGKGMGEAAKDRARIRALQLRIIGERGCRPLEVCRLRTEEWVDKPGYAGFELARHKTSHKGVPGVIPLSEKSAERMRVLIHRPDRVGPWVFAPHLPDRDGPPSDGAMRDWWGRTRAKVKEAKGYELYAFRNCVSNRLRLAGVAGRRMQLAMRHTDDVADSVYRRDDLAEAAEIFRAAGLG